MESGAGKPLTGKTMGVTLGNMLAMIVACTEAITLLCAELDEMEAAPKGTKVAKGIEIAGRMVRQLNEEKICDGVHIMAIGKEEVVPDILDAAGL